MNVPDRGAMARRIEELLERRLLYPLTIAEQDELDGLYAQENSPDPQPPPS